MRASGYYWVKYVGKWIVAEWDQGDASWFICGAEEWGDDNRFDEIGIKIEPPK